ncbi:MAG: helix-hairpin-helix domain-containing protein [Longimicrobiales bacterium]|nr:helix-hairpin-helix domain-containing protein [Longimicrobiales bacterium]
MKRVRADRATLKTLQAIPGVGEAISRDLRDLGIRSVEELSGRDPDRLYRRLCELQGAPVDRCMLYVFRCAVYYASEAEHEPALLQWWNWTDARMEAREARRQDPSLTVTLRGFT